MMTLPLSFIQNSTLLGAISYYVFTDGCTKIARSRRCLSEVIGGLLGRRTWIASATKRHDVAMLPAGCSCIIDGFEYTDIRAVVLLVFCHKMTESWEQGTGGAGLDHDLQWSEIRWILNDVTKTTIQPPRSEFLRDAFEMTPA